MNRDRLMDFGASFLALALCLLSPAFAGSMKSITVGNLPTSVAVNQTTNRIYVSNLTSHTVSVIDGASDTVGATISVGSLPEVVDVNSITNMIYVANFGGNSLSVIDGSSNSVVATITGLTAPAGVAVDSITNQIFVSNSSGGNYVAVIDGGTNTIITKIAVGSYPFGVRVNSTANLVYVANEFSGTISVIDGNRDTVINTFILPQGSNPVVIAMDPITSHLFVTDSANKVVYVLDASTGTLLKTVTGGKVPFKSPVYVAMFQPGKSVLISDLSLNSVTEVSEHILPHGRPQRRERPDRNRHEPQDRENLCSRERQRHGKRIHAISRSGEVERESPACGAAACFRGFSGVSLLLI